jgi:endonuclease/exonuclease/phosphatase family metal-dependent hydrolase
LTVLQEVRQPAAPRPGTTWLGPNPRNGIAFVASPRVEIRLERVKRGAPWSIVPIEVLAPDSLHVLTVWTRQEHGYIAALAKALTSYKSFLRAAPSIVIGDLNANAIWDSPKRPVDFSRVARRLSDEFGLVSAYHARTAEAFGAESEATHYFWRRRERPFHIDYCFIPKGWVSRLKEVAILDRPPWDALSDHRPLVVECGAMGTTK